jgi:hypothetical protein
MKRYMFKTIWSSAGGLGGAARSAAVLTHVHGDMAALHAVAPPRHNKMKARPSATQGSIQTLSRMMEVRPTRGLISG